MLDLAYALFIGGSLLYLLLSPRKEAPLLIVAHACLQYFSALVMWVGEMDDALSGLLLGFIAASSLLLIWARALNYGREHHMLVVLLSLAQWLLLFAALLIVFWYHTPYVPGYASAHGYRAVSFVLRPFLRVGSNLMLFSAFLLTVLQWGNYWEIRQSLQRLLPLVLYLLLLIWLYSRSAAAWGDMPFS